jgi:hypothetical protein
VGTNRVEDQEASMSTPSGMFPSFDRASFEASEDFTVIGDGQIGGKALGLASAKRIVEEAFPPGTTSDIRVGIPRLVVLATGAFEQFVQQNDLQDFAASDLPDDRIAHAFVNAEFPPALVGDLRALVQQMKSPLAVRSSSLLEDALSHPFAGVYATKMIPNNHTSVSDRFKKLSEAIKFVWASTFFRDARQYMRAIDSPIDQERMAVIIQEVVGDPFGERFYPIVSGVIRTHNYYPSAPAGPEDGVVNLALGLGKTIVDGGVTWTYSPRFPRHRPPLGSIRDLMHGTQTRFWAVNLQPAPYDPINESEYLTESGLDVAEYDDVLRFTASTFDAGSERLRIGTETPGPRVLTFARILELEDIPLNTVITRLAQHCKESLQTDVEIEFAVTFDRRSGSPARFGFLQVRPMMVGRESVQVAAEDLQSNRALVTCQNVLGNGESRSIRNVVYVKPSTFEARYTRTVAEELEPLNRALVEEGQDYVLIGFGRWGSSDPWLGIPATWPQVSGARVIVEATTPDMNVDASQGSHFFHNMISFHVLYFTVRHTARRGVDWEWLDRQPAVSETQFLRHVRLDQPLEIRVDGRHGHGVILHP